MFLLYNNKRKKVETISNYTPKLSWYHNMRDTFTSDGGKIKSFSKSPLREKRMVKKETDSKSLICSIDAAKYDDEDDDLDAVILPIDHKMENNSKTRIIVEPYEEYDDDDDDQQGEYQEQAISMGLQGASVSEAAEIKCPSQKEPVITLSSNELFLQSLKSTLDKLSEEKNMRARIKIQEILYQIMYGTS